MFLTIALVLIVLWALGFFVFPVVGSSTGRWDPDLVGTRPPEFDTESSRLLGAEGNLRSNRTTE